MKSGIEKKMPLGNTETDPPLPTTMKFTAAGGGGEFKVFIFSSIVPWWLNIHFPFGLTWCHFQQKKHIFMNVVFLEGGGAGQSRHPLFLLCRKLRYIVKLGEEGATPLFLLS